ncbi:MAG: lysophospholipid acyltransferase family protein, partial [Verrucomicrobiota bacterium]
ASSAFGRRRHLNEEPVIIAFNHPSWWDPLTCMTVAGLFPEHHHYAPIEAQALEQYPFFKHLGIFAIDSNSPQGLRQLLLATASIFQGQKNILWISPQGNFRDIRQRPPMLKPGIGALCASMQKKGRGSVIPLAMEYMFWTEKKPEIFIAFGEKIDLANTDKTTAQNWVQIIESAMQKTQDKLAEQVIARDADAFRPVFSSNSSTHPVYDIWRRFTFALRGKHYYREHAATIPRQD